MIRTRAAFSLIELLVVVALISVIAALAAGTYFRVRGGQTIAATESTLSKLNTGLERLWSAVRDQADKEFTTGQLIGNCTKEKLLGFAGGPNEKDRARAIWLYFRIKSEFPQTFNEARSPVTIPMVGVLPPKSLFANLPAVTDAATPRLTLNDYNDHAAALLYMILTEKGNRGELFDAQPLNSFIAEREVNYDGTVDPPRRASFRMFVDAWGTPITFIRYFTNSEIQDVPFARSSSLLFQNFNALPPRQSNHPFDPTARLGDPTWSNISVFLTASNSIVPVPNTPPRLDRAFRMNFLISAISAGVNKTWDDLDVRGSAAAPYANVGIVVDPAALGASGFTSDNLYGYRLRKFGERSD